ncbi:hypothetical protein A2U01_0066589 [Trifolium medium]|uniref:Uncharacterized protein n=1 Tax=Trifolium medium TaxID=97028 RepID=A0A392SBL3_9FABA|nr:hypothetical protein [Trifolium medium]
MDSNDSKDHDKSMDSLRSTNILKKLLALIKAGKEGDKQAPEGPSMEECKHELFPVKILNNFFTWGTCH